MASVRRYRVRLGRHGGGSLTIYVNARDVNQAREAALGGYPAYHVLSIDEA